jgi:hypothetical protein
MKSSSLHFAEQKEPRQTISLSKPSHAGLIRIRPAVRSLSFARSSGAGVDLPRITVMSALQTSDHASQKTPPFPAGLSLEAKAARPHQDGRETGAHVWVTRPPVGS